MPTRLHYRNCSGQHHAEDSSGQPQVHAVTHVLPWEPPATYHSKHAHPFSSAEELSDLCAINIPMMREHNNISTVSCWRECVRGCVREGTPSHPPPSSSPRRGDKETAQALAVEPDGKLATQCIVRPICCPGVHRVRSQPLELLCRSKPAVQRARTAGVAAATRGRRGWWCARWEPAEEAAHRHVAATAPHWHDEKGCDPRSCPPPGVACSQGERPCCSTRRRGRRGKGLRPPSPDKVFILSSGLHHAVAEGEGISLCVCACVCARVRQRSCCALIKWQ